MFARSLGGERLTNTRGAEEVDDEALTLAAHEVVEARVRVVRLDEGTEKGLAICGQYETVECLRVPGNRCDVLDVELDCQRVST